MSKDVIGPDGQAIRKLPKNMNFTSAKQIWIGAPKIGKTSTAAALGTVSEKYNLGFKPFFILFEGGSGGVEFEGTSQKCSDCKGAGKVGKKKCETCGGTGSVRLILSDTKEIRKWFEWVVKTDYNPIILDTCDAMFQTVMDSICAELGIVSPYGAGDHGIAWSMIYDEMRELLGILDGADKGIILIMHVYMVEKRISGGIVQKSTFNVAGKTRQYLAGFVNQILHFDIVPDADGEKDKHVLIAESQSGIEAGDQWGIFPPQLELGENEEEAAEAILECFGYLEKG